MCREVEAEYFGKPSAQAIEVENLGQQRARELAPEQ